MCGGGRVSPVEAPMVSGLKTRPGSGSAPGLGSFTHSPDVTSGPDDVSVFRSVMRCLRPLVEGSGGGVIIAYSEVVWSSSRFSHNFTIKISLGRSFVHRNFEYFE